MLLILATLMGCCTMLFACKKDKPENTEADNGLKYATEAVVDFSVAENITASGLSVKTDVVKTATNSASWKPAEKAAAEFAVPEKMADMTSYRELSIWMNNVSGKDYKLIITLVSDNPGTADTVDGYKTVALNIHAGWQMYNVPLSEMSVVGTPKGFNSISKITFSTAEGVDASGVEIIIDTINRKTQKFGTTKFFDSYPELANAVLFYDQHNKYLYNQSRYVLEEGKELVEIKADKYTTYVPVSVLAEHRGATNISASAEKVSFNYNGTAYEFTPASSIVFTGTARGTAPGQVRTVNPVVVGDYIMLPMEKCAEIFGYKLYYNKMGLVIFSDTDRLYFQNGIAYEEESSDNESKVYDLILQLVNDNYTGKELLQNMDELYGTESGTMRLLLNQERIDELRELVETDPLYGSWFRRFEASYAGDKIPTRKYVFGLEDGYRMLQLARDFMGRCVAYSFLYKMTDNEDYAQCVLNAMLDLTTFVDPWTKCPSWHVEHPLDFGEIMYGYAIGYNWLYDWFTEEDRKILEKAAWEIGYGTFLGFGENMQWWADPENFEEHKANLTDEQLAAGDFIKMKNQGRVGWYYPGTEKLKEFGVTKDNGMLKVYNIDTETKYAAEMWINNYNGVCNGGLITFLIAFANVNENFRAASEYTLDCTSFAIQWGLKEGYAPDGGYPEGYVYWAYGTTYTVTLLEAMYNATGIDQSFIDLPGFSESFYYNSYIGTTDVGGWNYHDSDEVPQITNTSLLTWAAYRFNDSNIATYFVKRYMDESSGINANMLMYYEPELVKSKVEFDLDTTWSDLSMSVFRSDWENERVFAGIQGGWNNITHGMHDIGQFIAEFDGVRFFTVLGKDEYNITAYGDGVNPTYFTVSGYWLYKKRAEGTNTLVIDPTKVDTTNLATGDQGQKTNWDQMHAVYSKTLRYESGKNSALAIVDMSVAYDAPYLDRMVKNSGRRGLLLTENRSTVIIQDEFTLTPTKKHTVYWFGHTPKGMECSISDDGKTAVLTMDGKSLLVQIVTPKDATYDFKFSFGPADYLPETGLTSVEGEYSRVGLGKLIAKGVNLSGTIKLAVVCRLLSDGPSSYTYTNLDDWKVD